MADRSQIAAVLADPNATPQEKYEALVANGWSKDAAARATGYAVPTSGAATTTIADTAKKAEDAAKAAGQAAQAATAAATTAVPAAQAATAASGVDAFKKFIVTNNPGVKIEDLPNDLAALQKAYPKGWTAYSTSTAAPAPAATPAPAPTMTAPGVQKAETLAAPPPLARGTPAVTPPAASSLTPALPADYAAKQARVTELNAKVQAGTATAADLAELKTLFAASPEAQPGAIPLRTPEETKKIYDATLGLTPEQFEAARVKAGQDATAAAIKAGKSQSEANAIGLQAYTDYAKNVYASTPGTGMVPIPAATAAATPAEGPSAIDAGAQAVIAQTSPDSTPEEAAKKTEALAETAKNDPNFAENVKKISKNWGLTILEAIQAGMLGYIGGYTGNWQKTAQQIRLEREEREKNAADELADRAAQRAAQEKQWMTTLEAQRAENEKNRALERELARAKYTAAIQAGMTPDQAAIAALSD